MKYLVILILMFTVGCTSIRIPHEDKYIEYTNFGGQNIESATIETPSGYIINIKGHEKENLSAILSTVATILILSL